MGHKLHYLRRVDLDRDLARKLGHHFEVDLYRSHLDHDPENVDLIVELGDLYSRMGMLEEGLTIDKKLVKIYPSEPVFQYNLACSHSLLGQVDLALRSLRKAIKLGYRNLEHLESDEDLQIVRQDERFAKLVKTMLRAMEADRQESTSPEFHEES